MGKNVDLIFTDKWSYVTHKNNRHIDIYKT